MAVVCVIPGDDAAPEAMNAAAHVLSELTPEIDLSNSLWTKVPAVV